MNVDQNPDLTMTEVLAAYREHGPLDFHMVKKAMGKNWPKAFEKLAPGESIFAPHEDRRP